MIKDKYIIFMLIGFSIIFIGGHIAINKFYSPDFPIFLEGQSYKEREEIVGYKILNTTCSSHESKWVVEGRKLECCTIFEKINNKKSIPFQYYISYFNIYPSKNYSSWIVDAEPIFIGENPTLSFNRMNAKFCIKGIELKGIGYKEINIGYDFIDETNNTLPGRLFSEPLRLWIIDKTEEDKKNNQIISLYILLFSLGTFSVISAVKNLKDLGLK